MLAVCMFSIFFWFQTLQKMKYMRIDGTTTPEQRNFFCNRFQTHDEYRIAILSITAANAGLNLTSAKLVVFAELFWNPGVRILKYRIRPNYRPCPHNPPPLTYYRPLDDLFPDFLLYFHLLSPTWRSFGTSGREQIYISAPGAY